MKKLSLIIKNEQGFFLPYVMSITIILLVLITSSIGVYRNEIQITDNLIEHIRVESLVQMAYVSFNKDYTPLESGERDSLLYTFPYGSATINYRQLSQRIVELDIIIRTGKVARYIFTKQISIPNTTDSMPPAD